MENGAVIGALAIFTIGAALLLGFGALAYFLRDRENREHAHRTLVRDETSAATDAHESGLAPLGERLKHSQASSHPYDPGRPNRRNEEVVAN